MPVHPRGTARRALIRVAAAPLILLVVLVFIPVPPATGLNTFEVSGTLVRVHPPCCGDVVFEIEGEILLPVKVMERFKKADA